MKTYSKSPANYYTLLTEEEERSLMTAKMKKDLLMASFASHLRHIESSRLSAKG